MPTRQDVEARWAWLERFEARFAPIASALGVIFVLVVIGENFADRDSPLRTAFFIAGWLIWGVFVAEFALRAAIAPSRRTFFARNWWQLIFLVLPFLRFIAALRVARLARAGRIVSSAVRGTRSAGGVLRDRLTWLTLVHMIVVLTVSQLLFEFAADGSSYGEILHAVALASVAGEPLGLENALARITDVVLALYSVIVFATAAGAIGAYFFERRRNDGFGQALP